MVQKKQYVMLQMEDYQGAKYRREFEMFYSCEKRSSSVGVIMHVFVQWVWENIFI